MRTTRNRVVVLAAALLATLYSGACSDDAERMNPMGPSPIAATPQAGDAYALVPGTEGETGDTSYTDVVSTADYTGATPPAPATASHIGDSLDTDGLYGNGIDRIDPALAQRGSEARGRNGGAIRTPS